jgi:vacuolar-type H+-ATPase subunit H
MPSTNPRIAITLHPYRYELLKRLAAMQGVSMASLVTGIMDELYPMLERLCIVLEASQEAKETALQGFRDAADQAERDLAPIAAKAMAQFDLFLTKVEKHAKPNREAVARGGRGKRTARARNEPVQRVFPSQSSAANESKAVLNPRVVTRGSGPGKPVSTTGASRSKNKGFKS